MIAASRPDKVFIIDTSAILSGKQFDDPDVLLVTSSLVANELSEGGRDFRRFEYLQAKGLEIHAPSKESVDHIERIATEKGEEKRLSKADKELLALAVDVRDQWKKSVVIISDDYSIQNIAAYIDIPFEALSQKGITKKFKWVRRCQGCGKIVSGSVDACPFCGSPVSYKAQAMKSLKKRKT
jgi:endoribonuclease Nob1